MKKKKIYSLILALCMIYSSSVLSSCGTDKESETTEPTITQEPQQRQSDSKNEKTESSESNKSNNSSKSTNEEKENTNKDQKEQKQENNNSNKTTQNNEVVVNTNKEKNNTSSAMAQVVLANGASASSSKETDNTKQNNVSEKPDNTTEQKEAGNISKYSSSITIEDIGTIKTNKINVKGSCTSTLNIKDIIFYIDNDLVYRKQINSQSSNFNETLDLTKIPNGKHILKATIVSNSGSIIKTIEKVINIDKYVNQINTSIEDSKIYKDKQDIQITGDYQSPNQIKSIQLLLNNSIIETINVENKNTGDINFVIKSDKLQYGSNNIKVEIIDVDNEVFTSDKNIKIEKPTMILEDTSIVDGNLYLKLEINLDYTLINYTQVCIDNLPVSCYKYKQNTSEGMIYYNHKVDAIGLFSAGKHKCTINLCQTNGEIKTIEQEINIPDFTSVFEINGGSTEEQQQFRNYYNSYLKGTRIEKALSNSGYKILLSSESDFEQEVVNRQLPSNAIAFIEYTEKQIYFKDYTKYIDSSCLHEIGHAYDYLLGKGTGEGKHYISETEDFINAYKKEGSNMYSSSSHHLSNAREYFAEIFEDYFKRPDVVKEKAPKTYKLMDKYVSYSR